MGPWTPRVREVKTLGLTYGKSCKFWVRLYDLVGTWGLGFRVYSLGFRVLGFGFRVLGPCALHPATLDLKPDRNPKPETLHPTTLNPRVEHVEFRKFWNTETM